VAGDKSVFTGEFFSNSRKHQVNPFQNRGKMMALLYKLKPELQLH